MTERPEREEQALQEVGRTDISKSVGLVTVTLFLATVCSIPMLDAVLSDSADVLDVALEVLPEVAQNARTDGLFAANRTLQAGIERFEQTLEEESLLREWVVPLTQPLLTELGVGNRQVYLGRRGWFFLRADFDHVTGPGFLEPRFLRREHLQGSRAADPLPAILDFHRDLKERGIDLVVMPIPAKPTVHPEFLAASAGTDLVHNPSFGDFLDRLDAAGVTVFDPSAVFTAAKARGEGPLFLETDTHWTPRIMELTARELGGLLEELVDWKVPSAAPFVRRRTSVSGPGDVALLLEQPGMDRSWVSERTEVSRVMTRQGRPWTPDRTSEVLLLGDSFTNMYSEAALGWGTGAGLAEQLSFELGRPVDRIAINAGGSWSSRQALARGTRTSSGVDRLAGKRVVVYQFAARELSQGDWKVLDIPGAPGSD